MGLLVEERLIPAGSGVIRLLLFLIKDFGVCWDVGMTIMMGHRTKVKKHKISIIMKNQTMRRGDRLEVYAVKLITRGILLLMLGGQGHLIREKI